MFFYNWHLIFASGVSVSLINGPFMLIKNGGRKIPFSNLKGFFSVLQLIGKSTTQSCYFGLLVKQIGFC